MSGQTRSEEVLENFLITWAKLIYDGRPVKWADVNIATKIAMDFAYKYGKNTSWSDVGRHFE